MLLSAYDAGSHRYWRRGLSKMLPDWEWRGLALPPRHFSWRVRGNPLYWALRERERLECRPDLVVATSMVDLATLRGLVPSLAAVPTLLYFHENQFAYPEGSGRHGLLEAQMVSLYGALAADRLAFNSAYNRDSFLRGVDALLARLPDYAPREAVDHLARRSAVLPVPLLPGDDAAAGESCWPPVPAVGARPLRLLWPGRLEYDKGGEGLERILSRLEGSGLDYQLALVGQEFRRLPAVFGRIREQYRHRLVHFGWLQRVADYHRLLEEADMVLGTALHEFQGVAVMEAVARGCVPVLPARLAYPELYPAEFLYDSRPDDPGREADAACERLLDLAAAWRRGDVAGPSVSDYSLEKLAPRYRAILQQLASRSG
nr:DUF3524 domain-containing protein [Parahaliea mediterranea]